MHRDAGRTEDLGPSASTGSHREHKGVTLPLGYENLGIGEAISRENC